MDFSLNFDALDNTSILYEPLYQSLYDSDCVLVIGPKLSTINTGQNEVPILQHFSIMLSKYLEKNKKEFNKDAADVLPYIGLRWLKEIKGSQPIHLQNNLKQFYLQLKKQNVPIPESYKLLAQLPFTLVINTAPDDFMHQAFLAAGKQSSLEHYDYHKNHNALIPNISDEAPLVYNFFGYYENEKSLVITKEDEIRFINNMLGNISPLPNQIMEHLTNEKTYLFVGFDTDTWHLPLLLNSIIHQKDSASFFLEQEDSHDISRVFYEDAFNFNFVQNQYIDFCKQFSKEYQDWIEEQNLPQKSTKKVKDISKPQPNPQTGKSKVLILTSNPKDASMIESNIEINTIESARRKANKGDKFEVVNRLDIGNNDLLEELLYQNAEIIHFSGHAEKESGLLLYSDSGYSEYAGGDGLAKLFQQFPNIGCIVLNACHTEAQAKIIAQHVPNVIGTDHEIEEFVALAFARGFYTALFAGKTYEQAFFMAMATIDIRSFSEGGRPVFYKNGQKIERN